MSIRDTALQDRPVDHATPLVRRRRLLAIVAGVIVAGGAAWAIAAWSDSTTSIDAARVRIATVTRGDLVRDISADGRVIAANSPMLYAVAAGTVTLKVVAGDRVARDQVLADVDSPELRSQLAQERATLAGLEAEAGRAALDAQITRASAAKALDQAQIDRQAALRDLERNQRAFTGGAVAQIDVARAEDSLKKADIGLSHARGDVGLQGQGSRLELRNRALLVDRQRAVVDELARQVDALAVRAPFDGQVGQIVIAQRAKVAANAPVLSVVDLSVFEVEIKVPESFARDLAIGMPAQLSTGGRDYAGLVSAISPEVIAGEVTGRLRFKDAQPPGLRQNQRVSARIVLDTKRNVVQVERGPFVDQGGGRSAWVMDGHVAVKRPIELGAASLSAVEIKSGLNPGDRVVVSGIEGRSDTDRIRISGD